MAVLFTKPGGQNCSARRREHAAVAHERKCGDVEKIKAARAGIIEQHAAKVRDAQARQATVMVTVVGDKPAVIPENVGAYVVEGGKVTP